MANYADSLLATGQGKLLSAFQSSELRFRQPATYKEFLRNSTFMFPNYNELRVQEDRAVELYYATRQSRVLDTGRSHIHNGTYGDSSTLIPSWITNSDPFALTIKQGTNNIYSHQEQFNVALQNSMSNFIEGQEDQATDHLYSNRSQINGVTGEGSFSGVNFAFEIDEATKGDRGVQITKSTMAILKYAPGGTIFCDTISFNKFQYQSNQGSGNDQNLTFQFSGVTFVHSIGLDALIPGAYDQGFWIYVPEGTIGVLPWIPKQNREGISSTTVGGVADYSSILNPIDGERYALHMTWNGADGSSLGGYTQDVVTEFELSIDLAFENAPLSVATESTIQAFAFV